MKWKIKKLLREFSTDELSRVPYRDGELVVEYLDGFDEHPQYNIYYESPQMISIEGPREEEYKKIAQLDSRIFDSMMADTVVGYLQSKK